MEQKAKVAIIGAGSGGLAAGVLLANQGHDVTIFEKNSFPGGRNSSFQLGDYIFDLEPNYLMMKSVLDELFQQVGLNSHDYMKFTKVSPMSRLIFRDKYLDLYDNQEKMLAEMERVFPDQVNGYLKFLKKEKKRQECLLPCLRKDFGSLNQFFQSDFLKAIPQLAWRKSVMDVLGKYFSREDAKLCFSLQTKYLGMSPWVCPGIFTMLPYAEHAEGVWHVEGGLGKISQVMAEIFQHKGGCINFNTPIEKIIFQGKKAVGVKYPDQDFEKFDKIIINADFAYAMTNLIDEGQISKYSTKKIDKKKYSCSTFMLFLGLKKKYDLKPHTMVFAKNYRRNVDDIVWGDFSYPDFSMYVRNSSAIDSTLAPEGRSALCISVPVANRAVGKKIQWKQKIPFMRQRIMEILQTRLSMEDVEEQIQVERIITPMEWEQNYNIYNGATFNLAHNWGQLFWNRPHNRLESVENVYLVGGGTHPGSGLASIFESARISAQLLGWDLEEKSSLNSN